MDWYSCGIYDSEYDVLEELKASFGGEFVDCTISDMYDYLDVWELDIKKNNYYCVKIYFAISKLYRVFAIQ
jgi:23S rRNA U2552 (ribose-2'-O)-methylase RlmE/FtsJ